MEEQSTTDGSWWEIGFSCPASSPKLIETEWTTPALSENPSLVIYTRGISVARYAVGEAPDAACLPPSPGLGDLCSTARVRVWHEDDAVEWTCCGRDSAVPGGWMQDPSDRQSISAAHGGETLLGIPRKDGELGLGIRQ